MASGFGFRFGFFSIFFLGKPQTRPHCFFRWAVQNNCKSFAQAGKLFAAFSISKMSISNENENKKQLPKHLAKLSLTGKCHYTSESLAVGFGWQIVDPGRRTHNGYPDIGLSGDEGSHFQNLISFDPKMGSGQTPSAAPSARKMVQGSGVASTWQQYPSRG